MKAKVSIAMNKETLENIKKLVDNRRFRNKSHLIECAVIKLIEELKNGKEVTE